MKKLFEILGQQPLLDRDVGIEIECEGENLAIVNNAIWNTVDDGSLRGYFPDSRAEFVLKKPIPAKGVNAALSQLIKAQANAKLNFSFRTSVHVHVNVQGLTQVQLINMIYTYLLLEEAMMNYCGRDRKGNRFCLRLADAEGILDSITYLIEKGVEQFVYNFHEDNIRYSAINLGSLRKYGSLEFRGMRGNLDNKILTTWCTALLNIRAYAMLVENPHKIYDDFIKGTPIDFLHLVLQEVSEEFISNKIEKELQKSFSLSLDIPFKFKIRKEEEIKPVVKEVKRVKGVRIAPNAVYDGLMVNELNNRAAPEAFFRPEDLQEWGIAQAMPVQLDEN